MFQRATALYAQCTKALSNIVAGEEMGKLVVLGYGTEPTAKLERGFCLASLLTCPAFEKKQAGLLRLVMRLK